MNEQYAFILKAKTRPEMADAFETLFRAYVEAFEVWASKADLDVHSALPHMAEFFEKRMEYLEREFDIQRIDMLSPSSASRLATGGCQGRPGR